MRWISYLVLILFSAGGSVCSWGSAVDAFEVLQFPDPVTQETLESDSQVSVNEGKDHLSLSWSKPASDLVDMKWDFSFVDDESELNTNLNPIFGNNDSLAGQFLSLTGEIGYSNLVNLKFSQTVDDRYDKQTSKPFDYADDNADEELNRLITTHASLGLLDNRIRLSRRVSLSSFERSRFDFGELPDLEDDSAALVSSSDTGAAVLERVDATLLRFDDFQVSIFGLRNRVDESYQTFEDDEKKNKKEDPLKAANRVTYKYGAEANLGPISINMAEFTYEPVDGGDGPVSHEQGYEAKLSLDVSDLRQRAKLGVDEDLWNIAPTSIWVKYGEAMVDLDVNATAPEDAKLDLSIGGTWGWGNVYGNASYWHSAYDSRQLGTEAADWMGDGIDLSAGYSRQHWGVDANLSFGLYRNDGTWYQSVENGYDGTIAAWLNLEELPNIKASIDVGHYGADDLLYNFDNVSDYLNFDLSLDFGKYLPKRDGIFKRSMKLYYGLEHSFDRTNTSEAQESITDHTVFLRYSTGL